MTKRILLLPALLIVFVTEGRGANIEVNNTSDSGAGSLRQAILDANASVGVLDTIVFKIPGGGVHTITPVTALPRITDPVVIDGYTQPGSKPNTLAHDDNAVILIELSGSLAGASTSGLMFQSGNSTVRGLVIDNFGSSGVRFFTKDNYALGGCFLGTNADGSAAAPNGQGVVCESSHANVIGGTSSADRNIISGNKNATGGIRLLSAGTVVRGNFIGTDRHGTSAIPNGADGILIGPNGSQSTIGGKTAGAGNVISGNRGHGIAAQATGAVGLLIAGNLIGTNATGTGKLGNATDGVILGGAVNQTQGGVVIGGTTAAARNVISGNGLRGLVMANIPDCVVQGNYIGTGADGKTDLGNTWAGISLQYNIGALVGGTEPGEGNVIAFNAVAQPTNDPNNRPNGINISTLPGAAVPKGNSILGNSIHSNGGLGIDLCANGTGDGVTPNDTGDADEGPNHFQNAPVLTSVTHGGGLTTVAGVLNSTANTAFRIEFFANDAIDASGYGEGQTFIGSKNVTTDAKGNAAFNSSFPQIKAGQRVTATATATAPDGSTSEFSAAIGQLLNISTRLRVLSGDQVLIGGFIVTGSDSKKVLIRGLGPSLPVAGKLSDPTLELHDGSGAIIAKNDDWKETQQTEITNTGIPPSSNLESALIATLPAKNSNYTAIVKGKGNDTGIGLVEVYDLAQGAASQLANISTRGFVDTGDNVMIGGFIAGNGVVRVLVRAIGPSLPVSGPLADPLLELHDSNGATLQMNDNWKESQQAEVEATTIPPKNELESALVRTIAPGNYTAIVRGKNNGTGVALVEVYALQ